MRRARAARHEKPAPHALDDVNRREFQEKRTEISADSADADAGQLAPFHFSFCCVARSMGLGCSKTDNNVATPHKLTRARFVMPIQSKTGKGTDMEDTACTWCN